MAQDITTPVRQLVEDAKKAIEEISAEEAIALHGDDGVVIVDIRDVRELHRDGKIPGAFHCPRGMLEFWIDPASPYHKDVFAQDVEDLLDFRIDLDGELFRRKGKYRA